MIPLSSAYCIACLRKRWALATVLLQRPSSRSAACICSTVSPVTSSILARLRYLDICFAQCR